MVVISHRVIMIVKKMTANPLGPRCAFRAGRAARWLSVDGSLFKVSVQTKHFSCKNAFVLRGRCISEVSPCASGLTLVTGALPLRA